MRGLIAAVVSALCCAQAQQVITTAARTDFSFPQTQIAATGAPVGMPVGVALDSAGRCWGRNGYWGKVMAIVGSIVGEAMDPIVMLTG
jgi:hypothetical protein